MSWDSKIYTQEQDQRTYENAAEARRVTLIDKAGGNIDGTNPLPVTVSGITADTPIYSYNQITGIYNVEATIVSYTVPALKTFMFTGINWGGLADGEFRVKINDVIILIFRNSAANRTQYLNLSDNLQASAGDIIDLTVINYSHNKNSALFESTLIGGIS